MMLSLPGESPEREVHCDIPGDPTNEIARNDSLIAVVFSLRSGKQLRGPHALLRVIIGGKTSLFLRRFIRPNYRNRREIAGKSARQMMSRNCFVMRNSLTQKLREEN